MTQTPIQFGILGAARIAPLALIQPAGQIPSVQVRSVSDRSVQAARKFSRNHGIPVVHASHENLLSDPLVNAVYIALPNNLHCEWTIKALEAGKHVLCEKPFASNADEAQRMAKAAEKTKLVLGEAFHYRHHPLAARIKQIVDSSELGTIQHIEAHLNTTVLNLRDIRYSRPLSGGALMDTGSYTVNLIRFLSGDEPVVTRAKARCIKPQVDRWMEADFRFDDGRTAHMTCSLLSTRIFRWQVTVIGDRGNMVVNNPIRPHRPHAIHVICGNDSRTETVPGKSTFFHQLLAFATAITSRKPFLTDANEAIANMRLIDSIYEKSGLQRRGTSAN